MCDLASFQVSLRLSAPWCCKPDAIFVMTDPPMVLGAARWIQALRGGRLFHFTADIYPDVAVALGAMRDGAWSTRWLRWRYARWLKRCERVFALGESAAEVLKAKGVPADRILLTRPWADGERLGPIPHAENAFRRELSLAPDDVAVMYSGNMGRAHGFDTILRGIEQLAGETRLRFFFVGSGAQREGIERYVKEKNLCQVRFLPFQPLARLREVLSAADLHLVSQDPRTLGLIVPSKFAGALASARPVLFVGDARAEIAQCVSKAECGYQVQEGDAEKFAERLRALGRDAPLRERMGRNAREVFEAEYARRIVVPKIITAITS
jgi:glycosyltransferase involved in cell wall biosynthesis